VSTALLHYTDVQFNMIEPDLLSFQYQKSSYSHSFLLTGIQCHEWRNFCSWRWSFQTAARMRSMTTVRNLLHQTVTQGTVFGD